MCFVIFVDDHYDDIKNGGCYFFTILLMWSVVTKNWFGAGRLADIELPPDYEQESVYGHINLLPGKYVRYLF